MTHATDTTRHDRLGAHLEYQRVALHSATATTLLALPLGILLVPGAPPVLRAVGAVYATAWLVLVAPSTALFMALMVDAVLILARRQPVFLPPLLQAVVLSRRQGAIGPRRVVRWIRAAMLVAIWANPLGNLATSLLVVALRARPETAARLFRDAEAPTDQRVPEPVQIATPTAQLEALEQEVCAAV